MVRKTQRTKTDSRNIQSIEVIGYVRSRNLEDLNDITVKEQKRQIAMFAEEQGFELRRIITEYDRDNLGLEDALNHCRKIDAQLIYVDMKNWNSNAAYKRSLAYLHDDKLHKKVHGKIKRVIPIAISASDATMEAVERITRKESLYIKTEGDDLNDDGEVNWVWLKQSPQKSLRRYHWWINKQEGVGARRFNNFLHLTDGIRSIYQEFLTNGHLSHVALSQHLNQSHYLNSDGKIWMPDNVRKVRKMLEGKTEQDKKFLEFADYREQKDKRSKAKILKHLEDKGLD